VRAADADANAARGELCAIARQIADADALVRCEHAERDRASIGQLASRRCRTEAR
jgi:hypothetical protein